MSLETRDNRIEKNVFLHLLTIYPITSFHCDRYKNVCLVGQPK